MPREAGRLHTAYWRFMIGRSAPSVAAVIADSANTKRDLVKFTRTDPDRIHVIHLAGDHVSAVESKVESHSVEKHPYFLCVGFFKLVKNPQRILHAYAQYRKRSLDSGVVPCLLKLAGALPKIFRILTQRLNPLDLVWSKQFKAVLSRWETAYNKENFYRGIRILLELQRKGSSKL